MNKHIAFDNRLCYERDVLRQHAIHQKKLQSMLPTSLSPSKIHLDSNEPSRQPHLASNRKRQQLEKERQLEIFVQNQRLAAKMDHILHRQENIVLAAGTPGSPISQRGEKSPTKPPLKPVHSPAHVHMPGIRLDSSQTPMVDCYLSPEYAIGRGNACKKTTLINRGIQRQLQQQLENENRRLHERLKAQKPFYNAKKWDTEWQQTGIKFQHLHQNTTVGYLLPKSSHGTTKSPLASRRTKTRDGLPLLKPKTSHCASPPTLSPPSRGGRLRQKLEATKTPSHAVDVLTIHPPDEEVEDDEPEILECGTFVLLEATTRKGIEISVDELQIEMRDPVSGSVQPGDQGLVVRGRWQSELEAECHIAMDTLTRVAQEIDDLEMMIKLETVSTLPGIGNFPRLSSLLTEDELQRLLIKLAQGLNIQVLEEPKQLVITSRFVRSPTPTAKDDKARAPCRPRTCPSSLPSGPPTISPLNDQEPSELLDVTEEETRQCHRVLAKQLADLLNANARRIGFRSTALGFCLVHYWFHAVDFELRATIFSFRHHLSTVKIRMDNDQVLAMLKQIQHHETTPTAAASEFIQSSIP